MLLMHPHTQFAYRVSRAATACWRGITTICWQVLETLLGGDGGGARSGHLQPAERALLQAHATQDHYVLQMAVGEMPPQVPGATHPVALLPLWAVRHGPAVSSSPL